VHINGSREVVFRFMKGRYYIRIVPGNIRGDIPPRRPERSRFASARGSVSRSCLRTGRICGSEFSIDDCFCFFTGTGPELLSCNPRLTLIRDRDETFC
jgi:hypothetical protein